MSIPIAPPTFNLSTKDLYIETSFITTWETTSSNESIAIPTNSAYNYDGDIDWGEGDGEESFITYDDVNLTHTYADAGIHTVKISGTFERFQYSPTKSAKLHTVENLGYTGLKSLESSFSNSGITRFVSGNTNVDLVPSLQSTFSTCSKLIEIDFSYTNFPNCTSMSSMCAYCGQLETVKLNNSDLSSVTTIASMFTNTGKLTNIDYSHSKFNIVDTNTNAWQNSNALKTINMKGMTLPSTPNKLIYGCASLETVDVSDVKSTSNSLYRLLYYCSSLKNVTMDSLDPSITSLQSMFKYSGIENTDFLTGLDFSNITNLREMFYYTRSMIDSSGFKDADLSSVTTMYSLYNSSTVKTIDMSGIDASSVTTLDSGFANTSLESISFSYSDFNSLTDIEYMYSGAQSLNNIDYSYSKFPSITMYRDTWKNSNTLKTINLRGMTVPNIPNKLIYGCASLETVDVSAVKSPSNSLLSLCSNCSSLKNVTMDSLDPSITNLQSMFNSSGIENTDFLTGLDFSNITNLREMFYYTRSMIDSSGFKDADLSSVTTMYNLYNSSTVKTIDMSGIDASSVTTLHSGFADTSLESISFSYSDFNSLTDIEYMYSGAQSLNNIDYSYSKFPSITSNYRLWHNSNALKTINLRGMTVPNIPSKLISSCVSLETVDVSAVKSTSNSLLSLCSNCSGLKNVTMDSLDPSITNLQSMFSSSGIENTDFLTGLDFSNITNLREMFYYTRSMIDSSGFKDVDLSSVTTMYGLYNSSTVVTIDMSEIDASSVTTLHSGFANTSLESISFSYSDFSSLDNTDNIWKDSNALKTINLRGATLPSIPSKLISFCTSLETVDVSAVKSPSNSLYRLLYYCSGLKNVTMDSLDPSITNLQSMFNNSGIENTDFLTGLDFSNITNLQEMFYYTRSMIDSSGFKDADLSSVTTMYNLYNYSTVVTIDMSGIDASSVTTLDSGFANGSLESIDFSYSDFSSLTDIEYMYSGAQSLNNIDYSYSKFPSITMYKDTWKNSNALKTINMKGMTVPNIPSKLLSSCTSLETVDVSAVKSPSNSLSGLFLYCSGLKNVTMDSLDPSITNLQYMFKSSSIENTDFLTGLDFSNITNLREMFNYTQSMTDSSGFKDADLSSVTTMHGLYNYSTVVTIDMSGIDASSVTTLDSGFANGSLESIDFSYSDFNSLTDIEYMYSGAQSLNNIDYSYSKFPSITYNYRLWHDSNALKTINMKGMTLPSTANLLTKNNTYLTSVNIDGVSTSSNSLYEMFYGCSNITTASMNNISTDITNIDSLFRLCTKLVTLTGLNNNNFANITDAKNMFTNTHLSSVDMSGLDLSSCTTLHYAFATCDALESIDMSDCIFGNLSDISLMCKNATVLETLNMDNCDISTVTTMNQMLYGLSLTTDSYSNLLIGFAGQTVQPSVDFGGGGSKYNIAGQTAKNTLTSAPNNWDIVDGGLE